MADMGSIQLPKDHAGYGSHADSGRPLAGYFFFRICFSDCFRRRMSHHVVMLDKSVCMSPYLARKRLPSTNSPVTTADRIFSEFAFILVS